MANRITGFTVEYRSIPVYVMPGEEIGAAECLENPTDCCEVETECCPDVVLPQNLTMIFNGGTGDCTCANAEERILHYNPDSDTWEWEGTLCGVAVGVSWYCLDGVSFALDIEGPEGTTGLSTTPTTCDPLVWTDGPFDFQTCGICDTDGMGGSSVEILVVE